MNSLASLFASAASICSYLVTAAIVLFSSVVGFSHINIALAMATFGALVQLVGVGTLGTAIERVIGFPWDSERLPFWRCVFLPSCVAAVVVQIIALGIHAVFGNTWGDPGMGELIAWSIIAPIGYFLIIHLMN